MEKVKAPGLKWRRLASGYSPVWVANEDDVKAGFRPKTVNLAHLADQPEILIAQCKVFQTEMELWRLGHRRDPLAFDGTVKSLTTIYQRHPESPFHKLRPGSRHPYVFYLEKIEAHIGKRRVDEISGLDIMRWHRVWSSGGKHLAAAAMARTVLEAALSFGVIARMEGCAQLLEIAREARKSLPRPAARTQAMTAADVVAAREAAHRAGRPSRALAYAIAFETTLRLWDVIGQWWPIDQGGLSDIIDAGVNKKWFGLRWEDIDEDMVLRLTPTKTSETTGKSIAYPLDKAPMVLEELQHWPADRRRGPMIVNEGTGLPYHVQVFTNCWAKDRKEAGISNTVWARDLRASGISEGRAAAASTDDAAKVAGHSSTRTTAKVYDRANLEAAERFAKARIKRRKQSENKSGNAR